MQEYWHTTCKAFKLSLFGVALNIRNIRENRYPMLYTNKINNNKTYSFLYRRGKCIVSKHIVIYVRANKKPCNNLGITAGKKVGNAVKRNRAKRVIRAAYQAAETSLPIGIDLIIVARAACTGIKSTVLEEYLKNKGLREIKAAVTGDDIDVPIKS